MTSKFSPAVLIQALFRRY